MAKSKEAVRLKAEAYYIENIDASLKEVANLYKVTEKTIGGWAKTHEWEQKRLDFHASPTRIKQLLQNELLNISKGDAAKLPADAIAKLMATLDRLEKKADPIVVKKMLVDLDLFISQHDPEFAAKATYYHKLFLQHRISLES